MRRFKLFQCFGSVLILLFTTPIFAQPTMSITSYLVRDNNVFEGRDSYNMWMNHSALQLGYRWIMDGIRIRGSYTLDVNQYPDQTWFNSYSHLIALNTSYDFEDNVIQINGSARIREYDETLNYYNVNQYELTAQIQNSPSLQKLSSVGLVVQRETYSEYSDLDNLTYQLFGKYQYFFQSGLSLTANAQVGVKNYLNQTMLVDYGSGTDSERTREDAVKAAQVASSIRIAKSITNKMGLSFEAGGQWFLGDPIEAYTGGVYYFTENDLYDDLYAYQGIYASLQLTRQFAIGFQAKLGARAQSKDYAGTPALDDEGLLLGETRKDTRREYYIATSKRIGTGWKVLSYVDVFANFMYRQNPSNDPYYDFDDQIGVIGLSLGF